MAKGSPQLSSDVLALRGTTKKSRPRKAVPTVTPGKGVSLPNAGASKPPTWLTARARRIWDAKIKTYTARAQNVTGCETALAQYCRLEADLIDTYWSEDRTPPMGLLTAHRMFAREFFDTPASQIRPSNNSAVSNPFTNNGKRGE